MSGQAWRAYHDPQRGSLWLGTAPMVHKGFQLAWREIKAEVMEQMATIVDSVPSPPHLLQVYLTGQHVLVKQLQSNSLYDSLNLKIARLPEGRLKSYSYDTDTLENAAKVLLCAEHAKMGSYSLPAVFTDFEV